MAYKENNLLANEPDVLLVKDLERILHLGRNSAYQLVSSGRIKSVKVGTKYLIPKNFVIDFLSKAQ